jgi:two-component system, LuxR family, sensor kinase FixL
LPGITPDPATPPDRGVATMIRGVVGARATQRPVTIREAQLRSILRSISDAVIVIDDAGKITSFNAGAERVFGYAENRMIGRDVAILMPDPFSGLHDGFVAAYRTSGERHVIGAAQRVPARRSDGSIFQAHLVVEEGTDDSGRFFTAVMRDLTPDERARRQIDVLREEASRGPRTGASGAMASTLAHELNQPMTAVVNYLASARQLLGQHGAFPTVDEALGAAQLEALRAGEIVRHLRDLVSRGEVTLECEAIEPILREAVRLAARGRRDIDVDFDLEPGADLVLADRVQIHQVVTNLLRNAIHAMRGLDRIRIGVQTKVQDREFCRITVSDVGNGVSSAVSARLFRAFTSTKSDGLGLGLWICRMIVEAHGGRIWAEAAQPRGMALRFTLRRVVAQ